MFLFGVGRWWCHGKIAGSTMDAYVLLSLSIIEISSHNGPFPSTRGYCLKNVTWRRGRFICVWKIHKYTFPLSSRIMRFNIHSGAVRVNWWSNNVAEAHTIILILHKHSRGQRRDPHEASPWTREEAATACELCPWSLELEYRVYA